MVMNKLEIFEPAMCCSTGVCGVEVDPVLIQFNADLQWLAGQGVEVSRYNLSQNPGEFAVNPLVLQELVAGMERLPLTLIDGHIVATGVYLSRTQLLQKMALPPATEATASQATQTKPHIRIPVSGGCTPGSGCC